MPAQHVTQASGARRHAGYTTAPQRGWCGWGDVWGVGWGPGRAGRPTAPQPPPNRVGAVGGWGGGLTRDRWDRQGCEHTPGAGLPLSAPRRPRVHLGDAPTVPTSRVQLVRLGVPNRNGDTSDAEPSAGSKAINSY